MPPERVHPVGWIARRNCPRQRNDERIGVLLATGGGGTAETRASLYPMLSQILRLARGRTRFLVHQAVGPRARGEVLDEADALLDPGSRLDLLFRRADVVISTAGYNSVLELAGTDTPTLLVAIPRSYDDQQARVRQWGPRLGHGVEPGEEQAAANWLAEHVARPKRRSPVDLGPDGSVAAAKILCRLA
ncbi:glycosyltransferase [Palleronia caenipelagi]|nr:glycosyltransferase [Palleronia caenipelagi]